ncbi:MAG TPA: lipopolysaccharide biosynthesis protein [Waterburya sp.]|jgi:PST family polysaccharide transporter
MLIKKLKQILSGQFIRNVGWMGGAELANRIFRLATTVTLARTFSSQDYGLAAIIYTTYEFANIFTLKGGIGAKIIQADEQDVNVICDTSYWLNWMLCGAIFLIQCIAAFPIAWFYQNNQLILPLCTISLTYLMLPNFMVQSAIIQRENRLRITASCNVIQSLLGNTITVILALLGMGIWAVVWPILLTTPVWIIIIYKNHPWRPPKCFKLEKWQEITNFGKNLLGVELMVKLRSNIDYLIIGRFLGLEALGIYYFAFSAGVGITWNVMNSFFAALFPHLCEVRGNSNELKRRFFNSIKMILATTGAIILLQSFLAPFYVPIIFGQKWISAIPVLIIICLSVLPEPLFWGGSVLLNVIDKSQITLYLEVVFTIIFTISILISVKWGILGVAVGVLASQMLVIPVVIPILQKHLKKSSVLSS